MRTFLLFVFFTGVLMIIANELVNDKGVQIEYRYLPRDLDTFYRTYSLENEGAWSLFTQDDVQTV
jgi:hypothetical protein